MRWACRGAAAARAARRSALLQARQGGRPEAALQTPRAARAEPAGWQVQASCQVRQMPQRQGGQPMRLRLAAASIQSHPCARRTGWREAGQQTRAAVGMAPAQLRAQQPTWAGGTADWAVQRTSREAGAPAALQTGSWARTCGRTRWAPTTRRCGRTWSCPRRCRGRLRRRACPRASCSRVRPGLALRLPHCVCYGGRALLASWAKCCASNAGQDIRRACFQPSPNPSMQASPSRACPCCAGTQKTLRMWLSAGAGAGDRARGGGAGAGAPGSQPSSQPACGGAAGAQPPDAASPAAPAGPLLTADLQQRGIAATGAAAARSETQAGPAAAAAPASPKPRALGVAPRGGRAAGRQGTVQAKAGRQSSMRAFLLAPGLPAPACIGAQRSASAGGAGGLAEGGAEPARTAEAARGAAEARVPAAGAPAAAGAAQGSAGPGPSARQGSGSQPGADPAPSAVGRAQAAAAWRSIHQRMQPPLCAGHGEPSVIRQVKKAGPNKGARAPPRLSVREACRRRVCCSVG